VVVSFQHDGGTVSPTFGFIRLLKRLDTWLEISERYNSTHPITPTTPTSFREIHGPGEFLFGEVLSVCLLVFGLSTYSGQATSVQSVPFCVVLFSLMWSHLIESYKETCSVHLQSVLYRAFYIAGLLAIQWAKSAVAV
jgi:hypothetical protein